MSTFIFYFSAWIILGAGSQLVHRALHGIPIAENYPSWFWSVMFGPVTFIAMIAVELED